MGNCLRSETPKTPKEEDDEGPSTIRLFFEDCRVLFQMTDHRLRLHICSHEDSENRITALFLDASEDIGLRVHAGDRKYNLRRYYHQKITISSIPESIGDLSCLVHLDLTDCRANELPSSIGKLQNLRSLDFSLMQHLTKLPETIGDLSRLERLSLALTPIVELPESIGRLSSLRILNLYMCSDLTRLPESVCQLENLEILELQASGIRSLPDAMHAMKNLWCLDLFRTALATADYKVSMIAALLKLIVWHPSLVSFGDLEATTLYMPSGLGLTLARKRARFRTSFLATATTVTSTTIAEDEGVHDDELEQSHPNHLETLLDPLPDPPFRSPSSALSPETVVKLWPRVLANATHAFAMVPSPGIEVVFHSGYSYTYRLPQPEAIYRLLVGHGGGGLADSLVRILADRHTRSPVRRRRRSQRTKWMTRRKHKHRPNAYVPPTMLAGIAPLLATAGMAGRMGYR